MQQHLQLVGLLCPQPVTGQLCGIHPVQVSAHGITLLCYCLTFAQWIIHVHVYGMWGVMMRKGYAVSFLFWFLKIKTFLSRDFMETPPDTWTWKQMQWLDVSLESLPSEGGRNPVCEGTRDNRSHCVYEGTDIWGQGFWWQIVFTQSHVFHCTSPWSQLCLAAVRTCPVTFLDK